jgi:hypothetical protein
LGFLRGTFFPVNEDGALRLLLQRLGGGMFKTIDAFRLFQHGSVLFDDVSIFHGSLTA